jgi:hypothetical protein
VSNESLDTGDLINCYLIGDASTPVLYCYSFWVVSSAQGEIFSVFQRKF